MTISYSGSFVRLLFYWKGSVWKAVWKELLLWLILYFIVRTILTYALPHETAVHVVNLFSDFTNELPIEFLLGFYVAQIITRWWNQVLLVPWPDEAISLVIASLHGDSTEMKLRRHIIARYLVLCEVLALRKVSVRIRKRFPTIDHVVNTGLMTKLECQAYKSAPNEHVRWQLPLTWAQNMLVPLVGNEPGMISANASTAIFQEFNKYRISLRQVITYDWVNMPLVYTQAAGVGLYGYFALNLIGRQYTAKPLDVYFPFLAVLKFIFYVGWFKVAHDLTRPFGEDDDDIELNYLIDRHLKVSLALADHACDHTFPLEPDKFYANRMVSMPHTKISSMHTDNVPTINEKFVVLDKGALEFKPGSNADELPPTPKDGFQKTMYVEEQEFLLF